MSKGSGCWPGQGPYTSRGLGLTDCIYKKVCIFNEKTEGSVLNLDSVIVNEGDHAVNQARLEPLSSSGRDREFPIVTQVVTVAIALRP